MPRSRTLAALRNDVLTRVDMVGSTWAPTADINEWINQAWAELYDLLIDTGEKYYLTTPAPVFTTSTGTDIYPLPADHYKTLGVDALISGTQWYDLHRYQFERRNDYTITAGDWSGVSPVLYDIRAGYLHFIPSPPGNYTVRHYYYPAAVRMVNDTDTIDGVNGWELFAINYAAKMLAERDDNAELAAALTQEMLRQSQRITTFASDRNVGEAPQTRVARGRAWTPGLPRRWWTW
jgi:hypothetical protein